MNESSQSTNDQGQTRPRPSPKSFWSSDSTNRNPAGGSWVDPLGTQHLISADWADPLGLRLRRGMGFHPDLPDRRDQGWDALQKFATESPKNHTTRWIKELGERTAKSQSKENLPADFHLGDRPEHPLSPIQNQGQTNSCTAHAAAALVEYLYRWGTGRENNFSRMFVYYNARKLLGWKGDCGAYIRTTFKAMRLFGVPPESEWTFEPTLLDTEPEPYHYAFASNFKTMNYARIDGYAEHPNEIIGKLKRCIYMGFPVAFGFSVYSSITKMANWIIPPPETSDSLLGGHAVLAVGYNDNVDCGPVAGKGAIMIRNSWGPTWGDHGYGFLPYWYFNQGYAVDLWTAYDKRWLNLEAFD